ncbi:MAG: hypothetical protein ABW148_18300, partial [Sedimenticola sp.]
YSSTTRGGGAIKVVADRLELSGKILANGEYRRDYGTGSGGSIWLQVGTLVGGAEGLARIESNGGSGTYAYGGGSGGRVAINYGALENFDVATQVSARGGKGHHGQSGGAGTIYLKDTVAGTDQLRVDNSSIGLSNVSATVLDGVLASHVVIKGARIEQAGDITQNHLELTDSIWSQGGATEITDFNLVNSTWSQNGHALSVTTTYQVSGGQLIHNGDFTPPGGTTLVVDGHSYSLAADATWDRVEVTNGGRITTPEGVSATLTANQITVDATSNIDVSAKGNLPSAAVGYYTGGSYGGRGGTYSSYTTNTPYGSYLEPADLGMGGKSYSSTTRGGGAIKVVADRLELSGKILANGEYKRDYGTGSGGSIWLQVGTLVGGADTTARIQANGGTGSQHFYGGGSGGRIAIYYAALEQFNLETQVTAKGAKYGSYQGGEDGTIHTEQVTIATSVVKSSLSNILPTAVEQIDLFFINTIDPTSFTLADVVLSQDGQPLVISAIHQISSVQYQLQLLAPLNDGLYALTVGPEILADNGKGMDQDGDGLIGEAFEDQYQTQFTIDTQAPISPTVDAAPAPMTNTVSQRQITLSGNREAGTSLWVNGTLKVANGNGLWSYSQPLQEGDNTLVLISQDLAGNVSTPVELLFNVDSVAPVITAITPVTGSYLNTPPASIDVSVVEAGSGIDVDASTLTLTRSTTQVTGHWQHTGSQLSFTPDIAFTEGVYQLRGSVKDLGGLASTEHTSLFVIDQTPP